MISITTNIYWPSGKSVVWVHDWVQHHQDINSSQVATKNVSWTCMNCFPHDFGTFWRRKLIFSTDFCLILKRPHRWNLQTKRSLQYSSRITLHNKGLCIHACHFNLSNHSTHNMTRRSFPTPRNHRKPLEPRTKLSQLGTLIPQVAVNAPRQVIYSYVQITTFPPMT